MRLPSVDTGFFNLYLGSTLAIFNESEIRNLVAQKQGVISAISQSSVYTTKGVRFVDNTSFNLEGFTMQLLNTKEVIIDSTDFVGN